MPQRADTKPKKKRPNGNKRRRVNGKAGAGQRCSGAACQTLRLSEAPRERERAWRLALAMLKGSEMGRDCGSRCQWWRDPLGVRVSAGVQPDLERLVAVRADGGEAGLQLLRTHQLAAAAGVQHEYYSSDTEPPGGFHGAAENEDDDECVPSQLVASPSLGITQRPASS